MLLKYLSRKKINSSSPPHHIYIFLVSFSVFIGLLLYLVYIELQLFQWCNTQFITRFWGLHVSKSETDFASDSQTRTKQSLILAADFILRRRMNRLYTVQGDWRGSWLWYNNSVENDGIFFLKFTLFFILQTRKSA